MSPERGQQDPPSDRREPVGQPVVRGDASVTGDRAREAVRFDPEDPDSLELAARTVRSFAEGEHDGDDHIMMLRGAAACAALVVGEGSYKEAAKRADGPVTVAFIRKWARVHDLPQSIRRQVARGHIAPTAAKHIARVAGDDRYQLAWAVLDHDLTVREVRSIASEINEGNPVSAALRARGKTPGEITMVLAEDTYRDLRRFAAYEGIEPDVLVDRILSEYFDELRDEQPIPG